MNTAYSDAHRSRFIAQLLAIGSIALGPMQSALAQQQPNYAPPAAYGNSQQRYDTSQQPNQRRSFGSRVNGFMKRVFYGEETPNYVPPSQSGGRSLDRAPSYRDDQAQRAQNRPPAANNKVTPPTQKPATKPTPSTRYEPPKITPTPKPQPPKQAAPKIESTPPAPQPKPAEPKLDATPPSPGPSPQPPPDEQPTLIGVLPGADTTPAPTPEPKIEPKKEPAPEPVVEEKKQFLVGTKTNVPGRVKSPYPPYQELDVSDLPSGSLALDPTTNKVFEVP